MPARLHPHPLLHPLGDQAVVLEFGTGISLAVNRRALAFARRLREAGWPWVRDVVPSFTGVGVHYDALALPTAHGLSALAVVERELVTLLAQLEDNARAGARTVHIPVCYGGTHGPDLAELAAHTGLDEAELVRRHSATTGHVFMIGFAPGSPYMGLWEDCFDIARRRTPRTHVPAGSVAVANRQTLIYPYTLPGGWTLIGRTPLQMFDAARARPALLEPGDQVRLCPVSAQDYEAIAAGALDWPTDGGVASPAAPAARRRRTAPGSAA